MGIDFHGQNVTDAAKKAVKDAISRSCLAGLVEICNIKDLEKELIVNVTVAVSKPEEIDKQAVADCLPFGEITVYVVNGGLRTSGLYIPALGDVDDSIEVAVAALEVGISE